MSEENVLKNKFKQGYAAIFYEQWPHWWAGCCWPVQHPDRGLVRPWGIVAASAIGLTGFFTASASTRNVPKTLSSFPLPSWISVPPGTFGSALMAKNSPCAWPALEMAKGFGGGILMGLGSALAIGCNVGAFYTR